MRWTNDAPAQAGPSTPTTPPPASLPVDHPPIPASADACPVSPDARAVWLSAASSSSQSSSSALVPNSAPPHSPSSSSALDTQRVISSIPRTLSSDLADAPGSPEGGTSADGRWVYPSEQQFFNAMLRKNHRPRAQDMRTVVPIHNAVNEKAWEHVLAWEAGRGGERCPGGVRLSSFVGRPQDRSPKAWLMTILGYTPPFDRHDWIIDRCGVPVRYVIDFYTGRADPRFQTNISFHIDCRPALDSWEGIKTRVAHWVGL
ncbi:Cytochrome c1 heme lyase [Cryptotrichosporon argae]